MRKIYLFLLTLFCAVGASAQITQLSDISNGKCYTIKAQTRGYLYYDNTVTDKMRSSSHTTITNDDPDENVTANQIAILHGANTPANCYYLYSVAAQKFLSYNGTSVALLLSDTPYMWELTKTTGNPAYFTIKVPESQQTYINVTNWNADNGCKVTGTPVDEGNKMVITEAVDFNITTATDAIGDVEAYSVNYPVNLSSTKWIKVGAQANFFEVATSADDNEHWYIMQQTKGGLSPMYDNGAGNNMMRAAANFTPNNKQVSGNEKYLVRFFKHTSNQGGYVIQFATGRYATEAKTTAYSTLRGRYTLYRISDTDGHIGWNKTTDGTTWSSAPMDNDGAGNRLLFWSQNGNACGAALNGNNDWSIYPVTFQDDVPAEGLQAFIDEISTYYNANAGKPGYVTTNWVNSTLNPAIAAAERVLEGTNAEINAAYNNLKNIDTDTNKEIALPIAGRFYRIQNENASGYLVSGTGTGKARFAAAAANAKNNVFYYDGTRLLSYDNGYYLSEKNYNSKPFVNYTETLGEGAATTFDFAASPVYGKLLIKFSNGSRALNSSGAGDSNAADAGQTGQNYRFAVTEVEWLPVPMNTEAGYATLYSPVQLGLGDGSDRVEVYTVSSAAGTTATLSNKRCVPANTGVILKYKEGIQSNGCVYLPIQATTETSVTSLLRGSLADKLVGEDAYVLSKPAEGTIGLYKANKNQSENTWLNQGFHAYLPADHITGIGGARVLTFNFDDNAETGINAVEIEEAAPANAAIYDLSGRRVQNAKSGLYIINGKKVIK